MKFEAKNGIVIAGHRGDPSSGTENTMASFRAAIRAGVDMIETDIRLSKDGVPMLMHDADVSRTTNGSGLLCEKTYDELRALRIAGTEQIPSLEEFLALCAPVEGFLLDLEMKVYTHVEGEAEAYRAVEKTVALIEKYSLDGRILFNSFDARVLSYIRRTYGDRFLLHGYYPYSKMSNVEGDPTPLLDYACYWGTGDDARAACEFLIAHGIAPCTGCHSTEENFRLSASFGCAMFTENNPAEALRWRDTL